MKTALKRLRPSKNPSSVDFAFGRAWHRATLNLCVELTGLPALVAVIANFFTHDQTKLAIYAGIGLLVAIALRFFPQVINAHALSLILPWMIVVGLALVLYFVLIWSPKQTADVAQSWLEWQKRVEMAAAPCREKKSPEVEECLSGELDPLLAERPGKSADTALTRLASGVMAGKVLLANKTVHEVLDNRLSIDDRFIGIGSSEPVNSTNASAARIPEYLVPNVPITDKSIWVWELNPSDSLGDEPLFDHTLKDVLMNVPPLLHSDQEDFKKAANDWIWKDHLNGGDSPALIRFALLDPQHVPGQKPPPPSGCLGRPTATRAFMNSLAPLLDQPLRLASKNSGYTDAVRNTPNVRLYVWVYVPNQEVTEATWDNVLNRLTSWIQAPDCVALTH